MKYAIPDIKISLHRGVLTAIFDECDRHDHAETGGRLVGTYKITRKRKLAVTALGVIEPGPGATRSSVSLFQDGAHQEQVFRKLERKYPALEHLGNWHSHHVNGYPTLSQGDRDTYHRVVNHQNHNIDFFYALLVTARNAKVVEDCRYQIKHFVLFRNCVGEYEIPPDQVRIVDQPSIWPLPAERKETTRDEFPLDCAAQRARDAEFIPEMFSDVRPFLAKRSKQIYWRGAITLSDRSSVEVIAMERQGKGTRAYRVTAVTDKNGLLSGVAEEGLTKKFASARMALLWLERQLNQAIFRAGVTRSSGVDSTDGSGE